MVSLQEMNVLQCNVPRNKYVFSNRQSYESLMFPSSFAIDKPKEGRVMSDLVVIMSSYATCPKSTCWLPSGWLWGSISSLVLKISHSQTYQKCWRKTHFLQDYYSFWHITYFRYTKRLMSRNKHTYFQSHHDILLNLTQSKMNATKLPVP